MKIKICVIAGVLLTIISSNQMLRAQTNSESQPKQNQQAGQALILPRIVADTGDGSIVTLTLKVGDIAHGEITGVAGSSGSSAHGTFTLKAPDGVKTIIVGGTTAIIRQSSEAGEIPFTVKGEFLVDETLKMTTKGGWDGKKEGASIEFTKQGVVLKSIKIENPNATENEAKKIAKEIVDLIKAGDMSGAQKIVGSITNEPLKTLVRQEVGMGLKQ